MAGALNPKVCTLYMSHHMLASYLILIIDLHPPPPPHLKLCFPPSNLLLLCLPPLDLKCNPEDCNSDMILTRFVLSVFV